MPSESPSPTTAAAATGSNVPAYSVSELSGALKRTIESAYGHVRVRGEISACKRHSSGHLYLCLKDTDAVIDAVCWRGTVAKLSIQPADGLEVIATGRITTYPGRSRYQLIIEQMELAGEGAILKMLEDRRRRLAAEGLFDEQRKRPLPYLPDVIGVITSPTGAVIRDILHRLAERFPRHVLVWPVAVQGESAARDVAAAITGFNELSSGGTIPRPDLLIVARGGGSLEDLMAFNDEAVVRAAAASAIPLISAVGHETDTTLIDFASDRRAPTPTAAAEIAVPVRLDMLAATASLGYRLNAAATRLLSQQRMHLDGLSRGLGDPLRLIETAVQRLDDRAERLKLAIDGSLVAKGSQLAHTAAGLKRPRQQIAEHARHVKLFADRLRPALDRVITLAGDRLQNAATRHGEIELGALIDQGREKTRQLDERLNTSVSRALAADMDRLTGLEKLLNSLSPYAVLKRGYALVEDPSGHILDAPSIEPGMPLNLRFHDGVVSARAEQQGASKQISPPPRTIRRTKARDPEKAEKQPSLF